MSELDELTRIYQGVFGADILKAAVRYEGSFREFGEDGQLPTGGMVVLEFHNGRRVSIDTSEWGGASTWTDDDDREADADAAKEAARIAVQLKAEAPVTLYGSMLRTPRRQPCSEAA